MSKMSSRDWWMGRTPEQQNAKRERAVTFDADRARRRAKLADRKAALNDQWSVARPADPRTADQRSADRWNGLAILTAKIGIGFGLLALLASVITMLLILALIVLVFF